VSSAIGICVRESVGERARDCVCVCVFEKGLATVLVLKAVSSLNPLPLRSRRGRTYRWHRWQQACSNWPQMGGGEGGALQQRSNTDATH
jgi:hypothetical protein